MVFYKRKRAEEESASAEPLRLDRKQYSAA